MKKKLVALFLIATMAAALAACGSSSGSSSTSDSSATVETEEEEVKEYVSDDEIDMVFTSPDDYEGKYIVITGQVMGDVEVDDDYKYFQAYYDIENWDKSFVVRCPADTDISDDDYFEVDGEILGSLEGENYFGAELELLAVDALTVTQLSYIDAVVPTIKEITPDGATAEQNGITISVDKIQYAESETRVWITVTNNSTDKFEIYGSSAIILQESTQYEYNWDSETSYYSDETELSDTILVGASSSGMIVFPAIDSETEFQIYLSGYSDDWELDFDDFVITVTP